MKKTRFIPYGYTMRNGRTIIEHREADIIRYIFDEYIKGASLKTLAEELTARRVPYTEKTEVWDKARIARIIDNTRYTGSETYDPIIDEDTFEEAAAAKEARQRNQIVSECEGIALMRDRIRCGQCGAPMVRRICSKRKVKESWTCSNDICGCRVRISDTDLLVKVTLILNRIIENADLMAPKPKMRFKESLAVQRLQNRMLKIVSESVENGIDAEENEDEFKRISDQIKQLNRRIEAIRKTEGSNEEWKKRLNRIQAAINQREAHCNTYDDAIVRQMIECVKAHEGGRLTVIFGGGYEIEEQI